MYPELGVRLSDVEYQTKNLKSRKQHDARQTKHQKKRVEVQKSKETKVTTDDIKV